MSQRTKEQQEETSPSNGRGRGFFALPFLNHRQVYAQINAVLQTFMEELSRLLKSKRRTDKRIKVFSPTYMLF